MAGSTAAVVLRRVGLGFVGAGLLSAAVFAAAQAPVARTGDALPGQKAPGAIGNVAGQVPAQHSQALKAPRGPASVAGDAGDWWDANSGKVLAAESAYDDPLGKVGLRVEGGPLPTAGHPFFTPLGSNGRACVSCHQPANGMSVSAAALQARWQATGGKDPVFAAVDGSNCPSQPQSRRASHSLLLDKGLFRIFLPWPPKAADGSPIKPEFKIEVVRDPTGCNLDPVYGLHSANPMISVFRRPRVAANLRYVVNEFGDQPRQQGGFNIKTGMPLAVDPDTGLSVTMQLMADSREPTLRAQAVDAALSHEQAAQKPTKAQLDQIVDFESRVYAAQAISRRAGDLQAAGGPPGLGPKAMATAKAGLLGDYLDAPVFQTFEAWEPTAGEPKGEAAAFRASVARGAKIYMTRTFWIRDAVHLNTIGLGNPIRRTCATCHNAQMTGMDAAPGWTHIATNNLPTADPLPDMPLFRVTCDPDKPPHPFLGRVIYTHDPGRALVSGRCVDVGSITMQQFRGLAARAPYFANGSAKDLAALVDYYDRRFKIHYSPQEKRDLVNFLSVL